MTATAENIIELSSVAQASAAEAVESFATQTATGHEFSEEQVAELNQRYRELNFEQRLQQFYQDFAVDDVLVTSSFAATSAYFLHIISSVQPQQKIAFIDTGFHFRETLLYKEYLTKLLDLNVFSVRAEQWKHDFTVEDQTWDKNPDFCCSINKVEPLDAVKPNYKVWVSSLMRWQTDERAQMPVFEMRRGILKFNPMLEVSKQERDAWISEHKLPFHPLVPHGYSSIGCTHCTVKGEGRSGRWAGKPKTECGLHL